ncbi:aminopeptidase, partial [Rhodococcus erythropolis]
MHVYISVDMEGIAGIATLDQTIRGGGGYHRAQMLMTAETNAAIAGAFDAGAT